MGEESTRTEVARKEQVLGDITNRCSKKGFPLVPGKFLISNDTIRKRECMGDGARDPGNRKRVLGDLENIRKGKCRIDSAPGICETLVDTREGLPSSKGSDDGCGKHLSSSKARKVRENVILDCNVEPVEADGDLNVSHCVDRMEKLSDPLDRTRFKMGNPWVHGPGEAGPRDSCTGSVFLPLWLERARDSLLVQGNGNQVYCQKSSGETRNIIQTNTANVQKSKLDLGKSSILSNASTEFVNLTEDASQNSKSLPTEPLDVNSEQGMSGATELFGSKIGNIEEHENNQTLLKHGTNVEEEMDSGKACSCSFCLKAAYMWTDLLYQDFKGRLSEINKSRRDARFLAGRIYAHDSISSGAGNHRKIMGLESELTQHWRTLFLHSENALMCESARLQSNLMKLKELRENCKRDVEMINRVPSNES